MKINKRKKNRFNKSKEIKVTTQGKDKVLKVIECQFQGYHYLHLNRLIKKIRINLEINKKSILMFLYLMVCSLL